MSINAIHSANNGKIRRFAEFSNVDGIAYNKIAPHNGASNIQPHPHNHTQEKKCNHAGIFLTTLLGVGTALALITKRQGFSLNPKKMMNTPLKDWAIFKIYSGKTPNARILEIEEPEILMLACGSVAGGLAGGLLFDDKKYRKAKLRESVNQMLGNVLLPVACVGGASRLYKKYEENILKHVPQIKHSTFTNIKKSVNKLFSTKAGNRFEQFGVPLCKGINKFLKVMPACGITAVALTCGIISGNRVSNFLNEKVFHKKVERKIKKTDFAPHVDDLSMAITLMAEKSPVSSIIARTIPAFLCIPGLEVGKHR